LALRKVLLKQLNVKSLEELDERILRDVKEKKRAHQRAYRQRPDVKEKQRAYWQRPDVKEKKRAHQRAH
jgi:hypothetical protein